MLVPNTSHGNATKSQKNWILCSRQDTEGLQVRLEWTEMDALGSGVEMLPCGRGTHRRDMASPVSTGTPPLFTMYSVSESGPCHKQQHGWIWFHSFSQRKQTQTASPAASAWGAPGQAGFILPWVLHAAIPEPAWVLRLLLPCPPCSAWAPAPSCIPLVGETSPSFSMDRGFRASTSFARG